jgi:predicted O-methyltransferase YrrM
MRYVQGSKKAASLLATAVRVSAAALLFPITIAISRRARHTVWRAKELFFGSQRPGIYPETQLSAMSIGDHSLNFLEMRANSYNVTDVELFSLVMLQRIAKTRLAFEFGTADGRTSRNLAANLEAGGKLLTLNIPLDIDPTHHQDVPVGQRFLGTPEAVRIQQLWGNSRDFDATVYLAQCQFIFIDADHAEASVMADSLSALAMIDRSRGIIVWHDALRYGVQNVLPQLRREKNLPIYLLSGTNLAILCFLSGQPVHPAELSLSSSLPNTIAREG